MVEEDCEMGEFGKRGSLGENWFGEEITRSFDKFLEIIGSFGAKGLIGLSGEDMPPGIISEDMPSGCIGEDIPSGRNGDDKPSKRNCEDIPSGRIGEDMPSGLAGLFGEETRSRVDASVNIGG